MTTFVLCCSSEGNPCMEYVPTGARVSKNSSAVSARVEAPPPWLLTAYRKAGRVVHAVGVGPHGNKAALDILQDPLLQNGDVRAGLQKNELLQVNPSQEGCILQTTDQSLPSTEESHHPHSPYRPVGERYIGKDGPRLLVWLEGTGADGLWCSVPLHAPLEIFG